MGLRAKKVVKPNGCGCDATNTRQELAAFPVVELLHINVGGPLGSPHPIASFHLLGNWNLGRESCLPTDLQ